MVTPCRRICELRHGVCVGCGRTIEEIVRWVTMTDEERSAVMERVADWSVSADDELDSKS